MFKKIIFIIFNLLVISQFDNLSYGAVPGQMFGKASNMSPDLLVAIGQSLASVAQNMAEDIQLVNANKTLSAEDKKILLGKTIDVLLPTVVGSLDRLAQKNLLSGTDAHLENALLALLNTPQGAESVSQTLAKLRAEGPLENQVGDADPNTQPAYYTRYLKETIMLLDKLSQGKSSVPGSEQQKGLPQERNMFAKMVVGFDLITTYLAEYIRLVNANNTLGAKDKETLLKRNIEQLRFNILGVVERLAQVDPIIGARLTKALAALLEFPQMQGPAAKNIQQLFAELRAQGPLTNHMINLPSMSFYLHEGKQIDYTELLKQIITRMDKLRQNGGLMY